MRLGGVISREEFEDLIAQVRAAFDAGADGGILLVNDLIATAINENVGRDEASKRDDLSGELQGVSHGQGIGMTGDGDEVFGLEVGGLVENATAKLQTV